MTNAKVSFEFGSLIFSGEGEEAWLGEQLDKILAEAPNLSDLHAPTKVYGAQQPPTSPLPDENGFIDSLEIYIRGKGGGETRHKICVS